MMRREGPGTVSPGRNPIIVIGLAITMIVLAESSALAEVFSEGPSLAEACPGGSVPVMNPCPR